MSKTRTMWLAAAGLTTFGLASSSALAGVAIQINEIRIDQGGTDNDEYFELKGTPGASLDGMTYIVIGDTGHGTIEAVVPLTGQSINASGYFVVAEDTYTLGIPDLVANVNFENSDNVTHVLVFGFSGANGDDIDANDDGTVDNMPWTTVEDAIGLIEEPFVPPTPPGGTEFAYGVALGFEDIGPDGAFVPGHVYRCETDGIWTIGDFDLGVFDTPGADNFACSDDADGDGVADGDDNCPDLFNPAQHDCDEDGIGDLCEILDGSETDANGNNIPDSCENTILINEIGTDGFADFNGDGNTGFNDEFVEIVNISGGDLDISGWVLADAFQDRHFFPQGTIIPQDCGILVFSGGTPIGLFGGMEVQIASSGSLFLDSIDGVSVRDDLTALQAEYNYGSEGVVGETLTRDADVTGPNPMVGHSSAAGAVGIGSPGTAVDGSLIGGCPVPIDTDGDMIPDAFDNCPLNFNPDQADCDGDGAGDVCEIADGTAEDCNGNLIPDDCDIVDGVVQDCNENGVPDDCDLIAGTLNDDNGNGMPDECEVKAPSDLRINEIRTDQTGTDNDEYVELAGPAGTPLDGVFYLVIGDGVNGSGQIECAINLTGEVIPPDGLYVIGEDTYSLGSIFDLDLVLSNLDNDLNFENSDNVTHLLVANFFGGLGGDIDTDDNGTVDAMMWVDSLDVVALLEEPNPPVNTEFAYGIALGGVEVGPDGDNVPGHVALCPAGWQIGLIDAADPDATDTPGAPNDCGAEPCPGDITMDGDIGFPDLLEVLAAWGPCVGCPQDIDMDGDVGFSDLLIILANWGPCP